MFYVFKDHRGLCVWRIEGIVRVFKTFLRIIVAYVGGDGTNHKDILNVFKDHPDI